MKFMQDSDMSGMSQEAQLAAIAATLTAMDNYIGRELRDIKTALSDAASKHAADIEAIRLTHAAEIDKLKAEMKVERETRLRYESQGRGILIAIGAIGAIIGAAASQARVWFFGDG